MHLLYMIKFPASKMGRVSYERETKLIEEVKQLEEQHCKRLKQDRIAEDPEGRRKELYAMVDSLTDVFQSLTPNDPMNIRVLYEKQKTFVVSLNEHQPLFF